MSSRRPSPSEEPGATRRTFVRRVAAAALAGALGRGNALRARDDAGGPRSVEELWADFDPRRDSLEAEVIREWREDGGVYRHVRFLVGVFKGVPARMTAIYGFPEERRERLPAVMHIHGGGQRAFLHEVKFLVGRGYAGLSVNWGGTAGQSPFNSVEGARPGDPNTDWGAVDPSQLNVPGYNSILPGPRQFFEDREHPKNNNWYLLTLGCRRALTFLERQPEVDPARLGVHGLSMGGNLAMYVAGTDERVRATVPAVGGQGWRWETHRFLGGEAVQERIAGDVEVFRRTLSFESYAPRIRCPMLHRSGTNDFHGWMDDVYRTNALIAGQPVRYAWSPHLNHRLTPEVAVAMPLWLDHFLRCGPALPETPDTRLALRKDDGVPVLTVRTAGPWPVARCEVYYSVDPDPRARFWRSADVTEERDGFVARLPLHATDLPLFTFANVYYRLPQPVSLAALPGFSKPVGEVCLSGLLHRADAGDLRAAGVRATLSPSPLLDDFSRGLRDWYQLNAGNLSHQQTWTRKLTDPLHRGAAGQRLRLGLMMPRSNRLTFVVIENEWRSYRGPRRTFACEREIPGAAGNQEIELAPSDFSGPDGVLRGWDVVDQFGICAHHVARGEPARPVRPWSGPAPTFTRLEWV